MKFLKSKWLLIPVSAIVVLVCTYMIQYQLNVMDVENYEPVSTLHVPQHKLTHAKFRFIDVHNHQWFMPIQNLDNLVTEMDSLNMGVMVNLSGMRGTPLKWSLENVKENYPDRFVIFVNLNFEKVDDKDWPAQSTELLEQSVKAGAKGLKVYKSLGLTDKDSHGNRIAVDDPRLDPVWSKCGELGIPVLIHSGEPEAFWSPKDKHNERWLELKQQPDRYRDPKKFPPFEQLLKEQHNVFRKHPETKFIDAHLGWMGNDLERFGNLLDELPNVYTEIGAVLAELGRQPKFARSWMIRYQDRVMMGKDTYKKEEYYAYFRVLETEDEYFDYYRKRHAHWKIYGLHLPDSVLRKVYYQNAMRVIPGIQMR